MLFDVGEQRIIIKWCVFGLEIANNHDGNDTNNNIKAISLAVSSVQGGIVDILMLDRSSKMINGGGRALVLRAQFMKMVSYVQPVVRELSESWHGSAFDSWIHITKMYRYPRKNSETVEFVTNIYIYLALTEINFK